MHIALLVFYVSLFAFIFFKWKALYGNAWQNWQVALLFFIKTCCGFAYGYAVNVFYAPDSLVFFHYAQEITELAFSQPFDYLKIVFGPINHALLEQHVSMYEDFAVWHNLGSFTMVRINAIFNLFSASHFYTNIVFWNAISTIGIIFIWQTVHQFLNYDNDIAKAFLCFSPELLFWASGPHKEGLSLFCIGVIFWSFFNLIQNKNWKYLPALFLSFGLLWATRFYFLTMLIPCFIAYTIYYYKNLQTKTYWFILTGFLLIAVFCDYLLFNSYVFGKIMLMRNEFIHVLSGNTDFWLNPNVNNYLDAFLQLPVAFFNAFFRPIIWQVNSPQAIAAALAKWLMLAPIFYGLLCFKKWKINKTNPMLFISYGLLVMLVIGLIVDNSGAMVRYRSIPLSLLGLSFLILSLPNKLRLNNSVKPPSQLH